MTDEQTERTYESRVLRLVSRGMTRRAAETVIDAAMYGKGCIEGEVRERIEREKPSRDCRNEI